MVAQSTQSPEASKVIVFSERHAILAELNSGTRRLSDVVNDPMHKLFHLEHVKINRSERLEENIAEYPEIRIKRESIQAILVMSEPQRPPHQRISNYVPKQAYRVAVLLPSFHVVGTVHLSGKQDALDFVLDGSEAFALLSTATVTMTSRIDKPIEVPTAFINRAHVELATLLQ
jgi:hypothetical protein